MAINIYTPLKIAGMTNKEVRQAYSRLRSIANKRIERSREQGLGMRNWVAPGHDWRFPTIAEIEKNPKSMFDVATQLASVSKFVSDPRTTVSGEKKFLSEFKDMMEQKGYGSLFNTPKDVYKFIYFIEDMRSRYSAKVFDSGDALDVYAEAERLNIPIEKVIKNFDFFAENLDKLEKVKPSKNGAVFSQRRIRNLIKKWAK